MNGPRTGGMFFNFLFDDSYCEGSSLTLRNAV